MAESFFNLLKRERIRRGVLPVSGGRPGAKARSLTSFVGGDKSVLERVQTVLATHSSSIVHMGDAGAGQFAKLCNNALTISNLRNIVEVFSLADRLGVSLSGLREAFAHSSGGSFMLDAIGTKVTPHVAAHIASLNRRDMEEFASAMKRQGLDATTILNWGLGGADGLVSVVDRWSAPRFTGQVG